MTARRLDATIASVGVLCLAAAAAGAAGRAWYMALTEGGAATRLAYQDATVGLLAVGLLGLCPLTGLILDLLRPAPSRRAGTAPVESRPRRSGSRRTSRVPEGVGVPQGSGARLVRPHRPRRRLAGRRRGPTPTSCRVAVLDRPTGLSVTRPTAVPTGGAS